MFFCYNMGHETPWIARGTGKAPSTSHCLAERRQDKPLGRGAYSGSIKKLRFSMVPGVPEGRLQGSSFKDDPRAASEALSEQEGNPNRVTLIRPAGRRVSDRPLDLETDCPDHSQAPWHPVSSQPCVEDPAEDGLELPETRAPGFTKERKRDCALEGLPMAPYKKKPKDLGPIWFSWMNRASCSFQMSVALGPPKGRPRSSITSTNTTGFPPSMPCRCRQNGNVWRFISDSGGGILTVWMFGLFLERCSDISGDPSFCCGIGERSTAGKKSSTFSWTILGFIWNTSRPMPLNLTQQNMSGTRLTAHSPIVHQRAWPNLKQCCKTRHDGSGDHQGSFGLASMLPISLGEDRSFHYLYETQ
jgi:hypothetical protein